VKKQIRINDCDGSAVRVRALAASAGIQFGDLQDELYRLRDNLGPDRKKGYDESGRGLARGGAVSETEQRVLLELGKRGFAVGSDAEFEKFLRYARALHQRMMLDPCASPVGGAFGGLRMSGWNPIGGVVGGVVGGIIAGIEALC
jgi:hypothetical protein